MPGADFVVDGARQRIAMAVRFPVHGVFVPRQRRLEGTETDLLIVLGRRCLARDHATRKHDAAILGAGRFGKPKQRILAGTARTDHQDQPARPDRD